MSSPKSPPRCNRSANACPPHPTCHPLRGNDSSRPQKPGRWVAGERTWHPSRSRPSSSHPRCWAATPVAARGRRGRHEIGHLSRFADAHGLAHTHAPRAVAFRPASLTTAYTDARCKKWFQGLAGAHLFDWNTPHNLRSLARSQTQWVVLTLSRHVTVRPSTGEQYLRGHRSDRDNAAVRGAGRPGRERTSLVCSAAHSKQRSLVFVTAAHLRCRVAPVARLHRCRGPPVTARCRL